MSSHLEKKYGKRGRIGALGEDFFDEALKRAGLDRFPRFRSLRIPDQPGKTSMRGDIDSVLANGNRIVLVDVKSWKGGVLWTLPIWFRPFIPLPFNGSKPMLDDCGRWQLSKNMITALDRMRYVLPEAEITAMVVFVPTRKSDLTSVPRSVRFFVWPGGIQSYISGEALDELEHRLGQVAQEVPTRTLQTLARLGRQSPLVGSD